jgi:molybdenum cofactor biosynthesis enzyme MoaA
MKPSHPERWCAIPLSNWSRAYDKYTGRYVKASLPRTTFPHQTFVLERDRIAVGLAKVDAWVARTGLVGDRPLVLELDEDALPRHRDHASGVGAYITEPAPRVRALWWVVDGLWVEALWEEVWALSWAVVHPTLRPWSDCVPRALSWLPVGHACQASCPFCFSKASVSELYREAPLVFHDPEPAAAKARAAGAVRAVVTGGGEPTLLKADLLARGMEGLARHLGRVTLITNGHLLSRASSGDRLSTLARWRDAGLSVLAVSHHAPSAEGAARLMGIRVDAGAVCAAASEVGLTARWVCVLQKGGVDDEASLEAYLDAAVEAGVPQINFKELYVSTPLESAWSDEPENRYASAHAVPLALVTDRARALGWREVDRLPWGAPIFEAVHKGCAIKVAAYTEPTVHWERSQGVARSWNMLADGQIKASLEDAESGV